jgi:hypothetical protein
MRDLRALVLQQGPQRLERSWPVKIVELLRPER